MNLFKYIIVVFCGVLYFASARLVIDENTPTRLYDTDLYNSVIDRDECRRQLNYMKTTDPLLLAQFLDAGVRFPRGFLVLNVADFGNYEQCLSINRNTDDMRIEGKYYLIRIPLDQQPGLPFQILNNWSTITDNRKNDNIRVRAYLNGIQEYVIRSDTEEIDAGSTLDIGGIEVAFCAPKPCTTDEWITSMFFNVTFFGFKYEELIVRLPNDKPWVAADYVAIAVFSLLGFITILSTCYDVNHIVIQKRDPKKASILLRSFSVYSNTQRLLTFNSNPNALDCLDGIRTISMMWVIVGHTFQMHGLVSNIATLLEWMLSGDAVWISTGPYSVDSFFLMGGILLTYTSVGKMTGNQLLKRLPFFYLNRLLRMFPLLAAIVLLQASVFHRVTDGPYWTAVSDHVQECRSFWWTTLLHVQNFVNPDHICISHSWYVAIDIQLYVISPIILYWVLGKNKKAAWSALIAGLLVCLTVSTVWNFIMNLASTSVSITRMNDLNIYLRDYYYLPWTRGAPFFFGMIVGYVLYLYKGKKIYINMGFVLTSWVIALAMIAVTFYVSYENVQLDWDNQTADNFINSYMRLIWSIGLSWIIFACVKGYGGPINWFLTLSVWKLPARISFAMYLYHYPLTFIIAGAQLSPPHFSVGSRIYEFFAVFSLSFILSLFVTVVIDAPFSVLIKMLLEGGPRRGPRPQNGNSKPGPPPENNVDDLDKTVVVRTLVKDDAISHNQNLEINGASHNKNGIPDKTDDVENHLPLNKEVEKM